MQPKGFGYLNIGGLSLDIEDISKKMEEMKMPGCEGSPAEIKYKFQLRWGKQDQILRTQGHQI